MDNLRELSVREQKLISVVSRLITRNGKADAESIKYLFQIKIPDMLTCWNETADLLEEKNILVRKGKPDGRTSFEFSPQGQRLAEDSGKNSDLIRFFYNAFYERAEKSRAHTRFCEKVYGLDLCQHGVMDKSQLEKMLAVSGLDHSSRVLELGCGNGMISEFISDRTGCHLTGIDLADKAILGAQERVKHKSNRLVFITQNMDKLDFKEKSFDCILAVDALYFVKDLEAVLQKMKRLLKSDGKMLVFYHFPPFEHEVNSEEIPVNSRLGQALTKLDLNYQALNFSKENRAHWLLKKKVLLELKEEFLLEGNKFLYENRMAECEGNLFDFYRYLFLIHAD